MRALRAAMAIALVVPVLFVGLSAANATQHPDWSANQSVIVGVQGPGNHGQVVAYGPEGQQRWSVARAGSYHDITKLDSGNVLVSYVTESDDCGEYEAPCGRTGLRILEPDPANNSAEIVEQWSFPVRSVANSEVHDAEPMDNGRYLVVDMDRERVFTVNITTGDVRHLWNASQHYQAPADPTRTDWLHMNDVDQLPDARIMVSVRNQNEIVILDNGTVDEVINDGGDPTVIRGQHNPQWLGDGAVLVGDSGNDRAVELHKQPNGTWTPVWSVDSANGLEFSWPRDADRLANGHTIITDSRNNRLIEVDDNGSVTGILRTPALPYEADVLAGERQQAPTQSVTAVPSGSEGRLPVVVEIYIALQHSAPMPFWLTQWHVALFLPATLGLLTWWGVAVSSAVVEIGGAVRTMRRSTDDGTNTEDDWP